MRADNWRGLICMQNGMDIYLNLISFPHTVHCRLFCAKVILTPWLVNMQCTTLPTHDEYSYSWRFLRRPLFTPSCLSLFCRFQPAAMEAYRKTVPFSQLSQTQTLHIVWLLLLSVSLAAADSMANKNELPSRDRALKGSEEKMLVAGK